MLAKVIKDQVTMESITPFLIPEIGEVQELSSGNFVYPQPTSFEPIQLAEEIVFEEHSDEEILQTAHAEAARIIAEAEREKALLEEAIKEKALQDVRQSVETEVNAQVSEMRQNLASTIAEISALRSEVVDKAEEDLVKLALEIAKKIVGREVAIDREIALTLVKVSLKRLHDRTAATIRLHPEDFAFIQLQREKLDIHGVLELVEDISISPGGCLICTESGDIDGRIESQFEEISHGLLKK